MRYRNLLALLLLIAWLYGSILAHLFLTWVGPHSDPNFTHGIFVPLFSLFVLWQDRKRLRAIAPAPSWAGLPLVLLSMFVLILGVLGADIFLPRVSLLILLAGLIIMFQGWTFFRAVLFPWAFLILMIPISALIMNRVTFPLQLLAAKRVSTFDQNPETQALDLRRLAGQRGFEIVHEYTDRISGANAKRPALDQMLAAAHRREFDTVLVWAADRLARSVRHFLEVLDTLNHLGIEFVSFRENLDTGGPLGRAVIVIVSAVAELERNLIIERVRAGLRRARLEGRVLGRKPIEIDRRALLRDRNRGLSLAQLAKAYKISRTSVARALKQSEGVAPELPVSISLG